MSNYQIWTICEIIFGNKLGNGWGLTHKDPRQTHCTVHELVGKEVKLIIFLVSVGFRWLQLFTFHITPISPPALEISWNNMLSPPPTQPKYKHSLLDSAEDRRVYATSPNLETRPFGKQREHPLTLRQARHCPTLPKPHVIKIWVL